MNLSRMNYLGFQNDGTSIQRSGETSEEFIRSSQKAFLRSDPVTSSSSPAHGFSNNDMNTMNFLCSLIIVNYYLILEF